MLGAEHRGEGEGAVGASQARRDDYVGAEREGCLVDVGGAVEFGDAFCLEIVGAVVFFAGRQACQDA